jgi:hypothetical protein
MMLMIAELKKCLFLALMMRKPVIAILLLSLLSVSCKSLGGRTTTVVKPKYHHSWFDRKKDKKTKRTRLVKMRS